MNLSHIQRRAFFFAFVALLVALAGMLGYWHAVAKGLLPSPVQSLGRKPSSLERASATSQVRAAVQALPRPVQPTEITVRSQESIERPSGSPPTVAKGPPALPPSASLTPSTVKPISTPPVLPNPASTAEPLSINPPSPQPKAVTSIEEALARHWLTSTNDRPSIRVHYDPADILRLVELGRGLMIAAGSSTSGLRELYLLSKPSAPPLFAPYTESVAERFSSYSLALESCPTLARLTTAFPVYFPNAPSVALAFVPDRPLAMQIFAEVAQSSRINSTGDRREAPIFEGQLVLNGDAPTFTLMQQH